MEINLPNVTLVLVEGLRNFTNSLKALKRSAKDINFGAVKFICPEDPEDNEIEYYKIDPLDYIGYNRYILSSLTKHIDTDYCLVVQSDGFILNPSKWSNGFLQYDYIGSSWCKGLILGSSAVPDDVKNREAFSLVGNGGFSLRSKKLLEATKNAPFECNAEEDAYICLEHYEYFKGEGINFAPVEVADMFARDPVTDLTQPFGFHGNRSLINSI